MDYSRISTDKLVKMNQDLGRKQDAIRAERQRINKQIRANLDKAPAPASGKSATAKGATLVASAKKR